MRTISLCRTLSLAVALGSLGGSLSGCGGGESAAEGKPQSATSSAQASGAAAPRDPIAQVVFDFLDAVRVGDIERSSSLLTPLALQRTSEADLSYSPPASPTARFKLGKTEKIEADKAIVESVWTEVDVDGKPQDEELIWALRLTDGAWRISGMAAEIDGVASPVVIDFENPEAFVQQPAQPASPTGAAEKEKSVPAAQTAQDPFQQQVPR